MNSSLKFKAVRPLHEKLRTTVTSMDCPAWTEIGVARVREVKKLMLPKFCCVELTQAAGLWLVWQGTMTVATEVTFPADAALAVPDKESAKVLRLGVGLSISTVRLKKGAT